MRIIKKLSEMIIDEAEGAHQYAKKAVHFREEDPDLASMFYMLANEELDHVNVLHNAVVKMIDKYKKEKGEPPEAMQAVYDYLHDQQIEEAAETRALLMEVK